MKKIISLLFILLWAVPAWADFGVDFKSMKKGTKIYYSTSSGARWVTTFKGKRGKFFVLESRSSKNKWKSFYNRQGHLVRVERKKGGDSYFEPYQCGRQVGTCNMITHDGRSTNVSSSRALRLQQKHVYQTKGSDGEYTAIHTTKKLGFKPGTVEMRVETVKDKHRLTLTKYNLIGYFEEVKKGKKTWVKITKIE